MAILINYKLLLLLLLLLKLLFNQSKKKSYYIPLWMAMEVYDVLTWTVCFLVNDILVIFIYA